MSTEASTRTNEQVLRGVMAAFERHDMDGILSFYPGDDDFVYRDMAEPDKLYRGRDELRMWLEEFYAVLDMVGARMDVVSTTSEDDRVAGQLEFHATYIGEGAPAGGLPVVFHACVLQRIEDGAIRDERLYMDSAAIARQLER